MVIIAKLRLTKAFLGDLPADKRGIRRIRMENGRVQFTDSQWRERLQKAARELQLDVNINAIRPPRGIVPATIQLYRRTWSGAHVELFESFKKGTILTMLFMVDAELPKAPSLEQLRLLLQFMGEWLGLTQWGAGKFGYGTFLVESLEPSTPETLTHEYV